MPDYRALARRLSLAALLVAGAACSTTVDTRGDMLTPDEISVIKPGVHTKAQVAQLLGSPSNVATFGDKTWYYIGLRTATHGFLAPKVIEQQVVVVKFDDSGVVESIANLGADKASNVAMVPRETPTEGRKLGLFEQLFGDIGRFSGGSNPLNRGR